MTKAFYLIFFAMLLLTGCNRSPHILSSNNYSSQQARTISDFTHVKIDGRINVGLHTGYSYPVLVLKGDTRDLSHIKTHVENGRLVVSADAGYPKFGPIHADIRSHYLNSFTYKGSGVITGTNLNSSLLDLSIENAGKTTLGGHLVVRKLDVSGGGYTQINGLSGQHLQINLRGKKSVYPTVQLGGVVNVTSLNTTGGSLSLYWIKSNYLKIRARGSSFIQLAGVAERLDVELWGKACFKGRFLRANRAFVKTHDKSVAEISAVNRQHTLATGSSDIHFYNLSTMRTDFMAYNGSVLDMRDWNMPFIQEYNRYNL